MKHEYIFVDCEFTGLTKNDDLISCGIVFQDGSMIYYENSEYEYLKCNVWTKVNVLPKLYKVSNPNLTLVSGKPVLNITSFYDQYKISDFVNEYNNNKNNIDILIPVMDVGHYDMVHFLDLFGGGLNAQSHGIYPAYVDLNLVLSDSLNLNITETFDFNRESLLEDIPNPFIEKNLNFFKPHNALYDAYVESLIFEKLTS